MKSGYFWTGENREQRLDPSIFHLTNTVEVLLSAKICVGTKSGYRVTDIMGPASGNLRSNGEDDE